MRAIVACIGLGLIIGATASAWGAQARDAAPATYRYVVGDAIAADDLEALAPLADQDIALHQARVVSADGQLLARFKLARAQTGPVAFDWQPQVDAPFLRVLPAASEVAALAPVLARHVSADGRVFAWWDSSRELQLLSGVSMAFGGHLGVPLFVPAVWRNDTTAVEAIESDFWESPADPRQRKRFQHFVDALLDDEQTGVAQLQQLAGDQPATFVLHVRDIILLGQMAPDRIGVAFRDFPNTGDVHAMVRGVRGWMKAHDYYAYAVIRGERHSVRAVALMDEASGETLAARLLPFIGNDRSTVAGTVLVYRTAGFRVYQLGETPGETANKD